MSCHSERSEESVCIQILRYAQDDTLIGNFILKSLMINDLRIQWIEENLYLVLF